MTNHTKLRREVLVSFDMDTDIEKRVKELDCTFSDYFRRLVQNDIEEPEIVDTTSLREHIEVVQVCENCATYEKGRCYSDKWKYTGSLKDPARRSNPGRDGVVYWDYTGYAVDFYVGPLFTCKHWRKK